MSMGENRLNTEAREKVQNDIEEFLKNGGNISTVESGFRAITGEKSPDLFNGTISNEKARLSRYKGAQQSISARKQLNKEGEAK